MVGETKKTKSESKDTKTDPITSDGGGEGSGDTSANYSRGERQKVVTKRYLRNWDAVFGQKGRRAR